MNAPVVLSLFLLENRNVLTEERSACDIQKTQDKLADLLYVTQSKRSAVFFSTLQMARFATAEMYC